MRRRQDWAPQPTPNVSNRLGRKLGSLGSSTANLIGKSLNFQVLKQSANSATRNSAIRAGGTTVQLPRLPNFPHNLLKILGAMRGASFVTASLQGRPQ